MTEQASRRPHLDRDGQATGSPAGAMPPVRRTSMLKEPAWPAPNQPPVRRPECLALLAVRVETRKVRLRRRKRSVRPGLVVCFLLVLLAAVWYLVPNRRWSLIWPQSGETAAARPEPAPESKMLADFEIVLSRGEIARARELLAQAEAAGDEVAGPSRQLADLEAEQRRIMTSSFDLAERDRDLEAMTRIAGEFGTLWPDDPALAEMEQRIAAVGNALERILRLQEIRGAYLKNLEIGRLYRAERNLADLSRLGEDVGDERAKLIRTVSLGGGVTMSLRFIPKGQFTMGSPTTEKERGQDETPHKVRLSRDFWMGETEVTQAQWMALMDIDYSQFKGGDLPVENVSHTDIKVFLERLNAEDPDGNYRLPTEAEWEYACRAGTSTPFHTGATLSVDQANYDGNYPYGGDPTGVYRSETVAVKSLPPNTWGLYNMHGNVWEWCHDHYNVYPESGAVDPVGSLWFRHAGYVIRGGGWADYAATCRSAKRFYQPPQKRLNSLGFRIVSLP